MFQASEVEHANATILATAHKDIDAVGAEPDVIDFLVVCDELRLGRQGRNVPDGTRGVNTRCDDETRGHGVPVQGCQRSRMIGRLGIRKQCERREFGGGMVSARAACDGVAMRRLRCSVGRKRPQAKVVSRRGQKVS